MIKKYIMTLGLSCLLMFTSLMTQAVEITTGTYKDEIPNFLNLLGKKSSLTLSGYSQSNESNRVINGNTDYTYNHFENITLDTNTNELKQYIYYLNNNDTIKVMIIYGYGKVYDIWVTSPQRTNFIQSKNKIDGPEKSDFYREDLINYLTVNGWKNNQVFPSYFYDSISYSKDDKLLKSVNNKYDALAISFTSLTMQKEYQQALEKQKDIEDNKIDNENKKKYLEQIRLNKENDRFKSDNDIREQVVAEQIEKESKKEEADEAEIKSIIEKSMKEKAAKGSTELFQVPSVEEHP